MDAPPDITMATRDGSPAPTDLQSAVRRLGEQLFTLMEAAEPPSLFSKKGFYGTLIEWAMRDERFKTQLFRFVDVLPALTSSGEVARHLQEYLGEDQVQLSPALRLGLKAAAGAGWLLGTGVRSQVAGMARQFMLGNDEKEIVATLRRHHDQGVAFTVDLLGEAVVSETEAGQYAQRCLGLASCWLPAAIASLRPQARGLPARVPAQPSSGSATNLPPISPAPPSEKR